MKTMFEASGFRAASPFTPQTQARVLGARPFLGDLVDSAARDRALAMIRNAAAKIQQVRAWIAGRIDQDPMLARTFNDKVVQDNFWGYMDLIQKDQYYVDLVQKQLTQTMDPSAWDVSQNDMAYAEEWAKVIDIVYAGMQQYGGAAGAAVRAPGALAVAPPSSGLSTQTLLVGAGVLASVGILALVLKA